MILDQTPQLESMKKLLKRAVQSQTVPAHLEAKVRSRLREEAQASVGTKSWPTLPVLALVTAATVAVALWLPTVATDRDPSAYIARVSAQASSLMRVGLGDHIHCAIFRKYPRQAPALESLQSELPAAYSRSLEIAQKNVPPDFRPYLAHQCRFDGRRFVHLALRKDSQVLSVVIATRKEGESFAADKLVRGLRQAGLDFYQDRAAEYQIAAFGAKGHLVYVISSLSADRNLELMLAMAPGLAEVLPNL